MFSQGDPGRVLVTTDGHLTNLAVLELYKAGV